MPTKYEIEKRKVVNLDTLGVHGLVNELTAKYNQDNDTGIIRNWFRRNKLKSQEKHLQALFSLVQEARAHASSLVEFKVIRAVSALASNMKNVTRRSMNENVVIFFIAKTM